MDVHREGIPPRGNTRNKERRLKGAGCVGKGEVLSVNKGPHGRPGWCQVC